MINYQLPESAEVYIHRTGRTGRAGASGTALSLIGPREIGVLLPEAHLPGEPRGDDSSE